MFRASSCPSSGAYKLQWPPLVYCWNVVVAVSLVVVVGWRQPDRPRPTTLLPPHSNSKPEAATAVYKLLMMGKRMPETCWAVFERREVNLRDWCIWLVDLFEFTSVFYVLLTVQHLGIISVNNQLDAQFFFAYVYFCSLHVSGSHVPIIRRINRINTTSGICHSV